MGKDARLANIYIKIYNKYALTLDDLKYLSKYDPECFEKACKNIVYKIPETKKILPPKAKEAPQPQPKEENPPKKPSVFDEPVADRKWIEGVLSNLKRMEKKDLPVEEVPVEQVKELLGSLYMEKLFPHNDRIKYFNMEDHGETSTFNKKA